MEWTVEEKGPQTHLLRLKYNSENFSQYVLLTSDRHRDNPKCRRDLEIAHSELALERNAPILDFGDFYCAMQGKGDPRSAKGDIRPENDVPQYLDSLVDCAAEELSKYKHLFAVLGRGNHDEAVKDRRETDLIKRTANRFGCFAGGYSGFIRFLFEHTSGGARQSVTLFYTHGAGGGGQTSRGATKPVRRSSIAPDADVVVAGHIHEAWYMEIPRYRLSHTHQFYRDTQYHVQLPTYKDEFQTGTGWAVGKEMPPKPLGAWWMKLTPTAERRVKIEFERAT